MKGSRGKGLTDVVLKFLEKNKPELKNCREQGYGSAANMRGKNNGLQKRILDQNPSPFFIPWGSRSLNVALCEAVKSSVKSVTFLVSQGDCTV